MVEKSQYYADINGLDHFLCAPTDGVYPAQHADAINAIADDDVGFVAWMTEKVVKQLRSDAENHITNTLGWSWTRQTNCNAGRYNDLIIQACDDAITATIVESNRVEDLGYPFETPNWPVAVDGALSYEEAKTL